MCTKTNIQSYVMAIHLPDKPRARFEGHHWNINLWIFHAKCNQQLTFRVMSWPCTRLINPRAEIWKASLKHKIGNIPLHMCTKTNIQSYVMAMSSPDKSTSEDLKGIIETKNIYPVDVCTTTNMYIDVMAMSSLDTSMMVHLKRILDKSNCWYFIRRVHNNKHQGLCHGHVLAW